MINIGLNNEEDYLALASILGTIARLQDLHQSEDFPSEPAQMCPPGSDIRDLIDAMLRLLPDGPTVDPRISLQQSLVTASGALSQISTLMGDRVPTTQEVLQILGRSALLGAGRVIYILGPDLPETRLANAMTIIRQEGRSQLRAYHEFQKFEQLAMLVPPDTIIADQEARHQAAVSTGKPLGEQAILTAMAKIIGSYADAVSPDDETSAIVSEHVLWLFNVFSGVTHAYGWPQQVPRQGTMPGHFIGDLLYITNTTSLAFDLLQARSTVTEK